jgi:hypothetical protein
VGDQPEPKGRNGRNRPCPKERNMAIFEHEGKTYETKMTRAGVRAAEAQGLTTTEISEKPFSALVYLFFASLYSAYKVNPNKAAVMLDDLLDSKEVTASDLFEELGEAYSELFGLGESE